MQMCIEGPPEGDAQQQLSDVKRTMKPLLMLHKAVCDGSKKASPELTTSGPASVSIRLRMRASLSASFASCRHSRSVKVLCRTQQVCFPQLICTYSRERHPAGEPRSELAQTLQPHRLQGTCALFRLGFQPCFKLTPSVLFYALCTAVLFVSSCFDLQARPVSHHNPCWLI